MEQSGAGSQYQAGVTPACSARAFHNVAIPESVADVADGSNDKTHIEHNEFAFGCIATNGLPVRLALTAGEAHDNRLAAKLLSRLKSGTMLLADRGYDADWIRALVRQHGAWANIPPKRNRTEALCFSPYLYRARNLVERFFNKIKHCRRVATRYDRLAANYLRSFNSPRSGYGCALMSPRPSYGTGGFSHSLMSGA